MKIFRRILMILAGLLLALVLFLVGSVAVDFLAGRGRLQAVTNTTIPAADGAQVAAYTAAPPGPGPHPAVIMIHEFYGLNESITSKADGLAAEGYVVVAPDTFRGSTTAWIPRAIYQVITTPAERVNQDLDAVFTWLEQQPQVDPQRIAVLGFCYGGRASLAYSLHNPRSAATVIFYGSPETDPQVLARLTGPVLGIFGGADNSIPLSEVDAFEAGLQQAGVPHQISVYPGQPHAFVTGMDAVREGGAPGQAWQEMLDFLAGALQPGRSSQAGPAALAYTAPLDLRYYSRLVWEHLSAGPGHLPGLP
jgi:carboxymethylenebutenolidase